MCRGSIIRAQYDGPYNPRTQAHTAGNNVWFQGTDGEKIKFFHLKELPDPKLIGKVVPAGTPILQVGNSGTLAAHLHVEIHGSTWSNPLDRDGMYKLLFQQNKYPELLNKQPQLETITIDKVEPGMLIRNNSDGSVWYLVYHNNQLKWLGLDPTEYAAMINMGVVPLQGVGDGISGKKFTGELVEGNKRDAGFSTFQRPF